MPSWYRRIDIRMWGDQRFRALSSPNPNAQTLWIYLLTGPHTEAIPGLSIAGEAMLAEALGWSLKAFREAFREAFAKGLVKADWQARVLWIPNAIRYNPPESPNVVKSWGKLFDRVPECELKAEAWRGLKAFVEGLGEGFREAFLKGFGEGYGESPSPSPSPTLSPTPAPTPEVHSSAPEDGSRPVAGPEALSLAGDLAGLMLGNNPKAKIPSKLDRWAQEIDRCHRIDGYSWQEIEAVLRWSQADDFWRSNVLSGATLRRQMGKLTLAMKRGSGGNGHSPGRAALLAEQAERLRTLKQEAESDV